MQVSYAALDLASRLATLGALLATIGLLLIIIGNYYRQRTALSNLERIVAAMSHRCACPNCAEFGP